MEQDKKIPGTTLIDEQCCPHCGTTVDALSDTPQSKGEVPIPGSIVVCIECAGIQTIRKNNKLRKITNKKVRELKRKSPDVWQMILTMQAKIERIHKAN